MSSAPPFSAEAAARAGRRLKVFLPATLEGGPVERIHILNISANGALCHADDSPESGTQVNLASAGLIIAARVVWRDGQRFGIRFARSIDEAQIAMIVGDRG